VAGGEGEGGMLELILITIGTIFMLYIVFVIEKEKRKLRTENAGLIKKIAKLDNKLRLKGIEVDGHKKRIETLEDYIKKHNHINAF